MDALFSKKTLGPVDHHQPQKRRLRFAAGLGSTLYKGVAGLSSVVVRRARRGGLSLLLKILATVVSVIILIRLIPSPLNGRKSPVPGWFKKKPVARGDDLRIVVFGSQDVAASSLDSRPGGSTWTHTLCKELKCGTRHSFIPEYDRGIGLTSNKRYATELKTLQNFSKEANLTDNPAADYSFLSEQYPGATDAHDLEEQVQDYFNTAGPKLPPRETVYVFTFGTWDIWNLAAMPLERGEAVVDDLARLIFNQTEYLYKKSLDTQTIAHSGYWGASIDPKAGRRDKDRAAKEAAKHRRFNVVIPELLDISMTPGWQFRPQPQYPHSLAEHMRNSALLTMRWNEQMRSEMKKWTMKGSALPEGDMSDVHSDWASKQYQYQDQADLYPRRMGYFAETSSRMIEVLAEEDMQRTGESDRTGRGKLPAQEKLRFGNTKLSCRAKSSLLSKLYWGKDADDKYMKMERCPRPDNHLFYEPFTYNQRAVDEIGKIAAKGVKKHLFGMKVDDDEKGK
ncbi:hypothetical protein GMORB2_1166 [Geosmithia morbida]|uniref:Uncharacterized protein n=1 Tax=Geosmithia morbida TaxID=1094350 RepID=A0A9P4Z1E7_9HYPO|nr:uncharacterized protein GMORB2_1166 [Geosmithia morbida]KAF4125920.1 hypothetical protein GMORB2_1166 [Geosmithia morbida]